VRARPVQEMLPAIPFGEYVTVRRHCHKSWRFLRPVVGQAVRAQSDSVIVPWPSVMGARGLTGYSGTRVKPKSPCCAMKGPQAADLDLNYCRKR